MGSWGCGILQNDTAQDEMCQIAQYIEEDISSITKGSEKNAAVLGAAVGLLLQFSQYSFVPESPFYPQLIAALEANRPFFSTLPGNSGQILESVLAGKGLELATRFIELDSMLVKAIHGDKEPHEFPVQKMFARREDDLFRHPQARTYLQNKINSLVEEVDDGFLNSDEDVLTDLFREANFIGAFALLLILEPSQIDPGKFIEWQQQVHNAMAGHEPDEDEIEFEQEYYRLLDIAFDYGFKKFTELTKTSN